jgi:hypothetical protein
MPIDCAVPSQEGKYILFDEVTSPLQPAMPIGRGMFGNLIKHTPNLNVFYIERSFCPLSRGEVKLFSKGHLPLSNLPVGKPAIDRSVSIV